MFEIQKSGDKTSSGEIGLDIRTYASPKVGQDQVSGGVSVLCWHAAPVAYVLWKPCTIRSKSNSVIRSRSVMVKNWCNVLSMEGIGSDIHTSVYDTRDDFGFPIVNFPWLSGDVPRLPSYGIYISQLVRFARCCTSVLDFHSKNLQITSKLLTQGYRYHKLEKHLESSLDRTPNFCLNLVIFRSKNMYLKESLTRYSTVI